MVTLVILILLTGTVLAVGISVLVEQANVTLSNRLKQMQLEDEQTFLDD